MKNLYLIRHAQAITPSNFQLRDFDRPLDNLGINATQEIGNRLADKKVHFELLLTSPAVRTLTTARFIAEKINYPVENIVSLPSLYNASLEMIIEQIQAIDNQYQTVGVVAHNPGITSLANELGHDQLLSMPTCGVYCIELAINDWQEASHFNSKSVWFIHPSINSQFEQKTWQI